MKILLSAFACDPFFGSDEEVGWRWAMGLERCGHDVTVITRASHQAEIEKFISANDLVTRVSFVYVDAPRLHRLTHTFNKRNHIYYYCWQILAFLRAKRLHSAHHFDLVHHVTWVSFRQPSFMGLLGIPFIFGPVAGGDEIPRGYISDFSAKQKFVEYVRWFANSVVRLDPLMCLTYRTADKVIFTSESHLERVPRWVIDKSSVDLAIGVDQGVARTSTSPMTKVMPGKRLFFAGRCIGWKGMDIGLKILALVLQQDPDVTLTVVGDGVDRARWMIKAKSMGLDHAIDWKGWLPKEQVLAMYAEYDLLFYPSLRDSGGFVVLEALQQGLPVVCFRLGGPGVVVNEHCGAAVPAGASVEQSCNVFADAVLNALQHRDRFNCVARVQDFSWDQLISRTYSEYCSLQQGIASYE